MVGNPVTKIVLCLSFIGVVLLAVWSREGRAAVSMSEPETMQQIACVLPVVAEVSPSPEFFEAQEVALSEPSPAERYFPILVQERGPAYRTSRSHSHYRDPIVLGADGLAGESRRWGDASIEVQAEAVDRIVKGLTAAGYNSQQISFALALVRHESGFNPDAAAGYTSASGLGQFVDKTRQTLAKRAGIASNDPFCVDMNVVCLGESLKEMFAFAAKRAKPGTEKYFNLAYAYHHDGPSLDHGGFDIAKEKIAPWMKKCTEVMNMNL